jgi:hypothetical protein
MQERFAGATGQLQQVLDSVKVGHADIVARLSDALGGMMFQDVVRQRVTCVEQALAELGSHLQCMADQLLDQPWDPDTMMSLRERLQAQVDRYVMHSQHVVHEAVTGEPVAERGAQPRIELF